MKDEKEEKDAAATEPAATAENQQELIETLNITLRKYRAECARLEDENRMLRHALDLQKGGWHHHTCHDFDVDQRIWGPVPEMVLLLRETPNNPYVPRHDHYRCELLIDKRPYGPMAINLATDVVVRLLQFTLTGNAEEINK